MARNEPRYEARQSTSVVWVVARMVCTASTLLYSTGTFSRADLSVPLPSVELGALYLAVLYTFSRVPPAVPVP